MSLLKRPLIRAALALLAPLSLLHAQQTEVFVDLQLTNPDALIFSVGDLDFTESGQTTNYFVVQLENRSQAGAPTLNVILNLKILLNNVQIAEGSTQPFDLPPQSFNFFTNQQLALGTAMVGDQTIDLDFDASDIDLDAVEDLESTILSTGSVPAGVYQFIMCVIETPNSSNPNQFYCDPIDQNHTLTITNPTTLELLFPGNSVSESIIAEIATPFPYFQWYSDINPAAATYNIFVYEKFPEDRTVQDVLNHPAILHIENYQEQFFQYPTDSDPLLLSGEVVGPVRLLESGKIYYWVVESLVPTGTGRITLQSDIFRFKVMDLAQSITYAPQILAFLRQVLGPNYEVMLEQLLEAGFEPNGTITLDGNSLEMNQLLQFLSPILKGDIKIEDVEVFETTAR